MKSVELYAQVRYAVQIEGVSRREAARRYGIDPRTVAKMLAFSVPPGYRRSRPPARPKLDPFTGIIDAILTEDDARPKKQRHTAKRIFERLRDEHGYSGGITIVRDHHRKRLRAGAPAAAPRGLCAAAARSWPCAGGFWRGAGGDRRGRGQDPLLRDGPAAQRRLFRAGLSGGNRRSVLRRAQRRVQLLRQGAALDPVRQHHAGGGAHPGRRGAPANASLQRAAIPLRVCRPVWPPGQGQRQRESRGFGWVDPPEPAGAGAAGGELYGAERASARGLSPSARGSAARSRGDDWRTPGAGSGGIPLLARIALRRL